VGALRYHADRVIEELSPQQRAVARRLFLRLIWLEEGTGTMAGRRMEKTALVEQVANPGMDERVLQRLADERLVVIRGEGEQATVEVVHDTLPIHWRRLQEWMQEDREFVFWRQRLSAALAEWERTNRDKGSLLRRARLAERPAGCAA
jgi:DNA-binding PadR family transcriptional regulator